VVLKTTNGGQSWAHLASEPVIQASEAGYNNSFWWTDINHGWFGTNQSRIWRTTDGGASWTSTAIGSVNSYGISFRDANFGIATLDGNIIGRTSDGGATWGASVISQATAFSAVAYARGVRIAWATSGQELFRTNDDGASWVSQTLYPIDGGLWHVSVADTNNGWAVSSFGEILRYDRSALTGIGPRVPGDVAQEFRLDQNYPNPFNPATKISYQLSVVSEVKLLVYDILGRAVATVVNEQQQAGFHTAFFDGSNLASGLYFYRLTAKPYGAAGGGQFSQTRKMVLVK